MMSGRSFLGGGGFWRGGFNAENAEEARRSQRGKVITLAGMRLTAWTGRPNEPGRAWARKSSEGLLLGQ